MKKNLILVSSLLFLITTSALVNNKIREMRRIKGVHTAIKTEQNQPSIQGIILPHHNFAKEIIIDSYQQLSQENYQLIVIISPNHFHPQIGNIVSSRSVDRSQRNLQSANWLIDKLLVADLISIEEQMVANEHGINVHLDYLSQFYPEIEVLTLVMPVNPNPKKYAELQGILANLPVKTLFIASIDFAHDVTYLEALKNNQESIEAIQSFDYQQIRHFDDQHLDSPQSITLLLQIMQQNRVTDFRVWHDTHGALLSNQVGLVGTSYVVGVFGKN